jgi:putative membrane protein
MHKAGPARSNINLPYLRKPLHIAYSILFLIFWAYTGITTPDGINWLLENTLTLSCIILIVAFYNIFRLSDSSYTCILLFLLLHVYGSQYQYQANPMGEWLQHTLNQSRNNYDRIVHFSFGLLLTYPLHEILVQGYRVKRPTFYLLPVVFIFTLGALYELVEWIVADLIFTNNSQGMTYLGMQGDVWDAQKDMALGLAGAIIAMVVVYVLRFRKA